MKKGVAFRKKIQINKKNIKNFNLSIDINLIYAIILDVYLIADVV